MIRFYFCPECGEELAEPQEWEPLACDSFTCNWEKAPSA